MKMEIVDKYMQLMSNIAKENTDTALNIGYQIIKKIIGDGNDIGYQGDYRIAYTMRDISRFHIKCHKSILEDQINNVSNVCKSLIAYRDACSNKSFHYAMNRHICYSLALESYIRALLFNADANKNGLCVALEGLIQHILFSDSEELIIKQLFSEYEDATIV